MKRTVNRCVATEPFPVTHMTTALKGGLAFVDQKVSLTPLRVVVDSVFTQGDTTETLPVDSRVYVPGDQYVQSWAKRIYELADGTAFILVPQESVVFLEVV